MAHSKEYSNRRNNHVIYQRIREEETLPEVKDFKAQGQVNFVVWLLNLQLLFLWLGNFGCRQVREIE